MDTINASQGTQDTDERLERYLQRYSASEREIIADYWVMIGKVRVKSAVDVSLKVSQMWYWQQFDKAVVIEAILIHMGKQEAVGKKEDYTRGIMRNLDKERKQTEAAVSGTAVSSGRGRPALKRKKSRFNNFSGREIDYEAIEYIELLQQTGELEGMRAELMKDARYRAYL